MSDLLIRPSTEAARLLGTGALSRRRRRRRNALRALGAVLVVGGALVLADAAVTLLWQEPITALIASLRQDRLSGALRSAERAAPSAAEARALAGLSDERERIAYLAAQFERHVRDGGPVGRIEIPAIGASFVVVKGTSTRDLESGPGVFGETAFPGAGRTTAIAGHRTTYLAPFRHIDSLAPGDRIELVMPYAALTYTVTGHRVVPPTDVEAAVAEVGYSRLVLSACTPLFSAAKRLLVYARLTRTVPRGSSLALPPGERALPLQEPPPRATRARTLPPVLESLDPRRVSPVV